MIFKVPFIHLFGILGILMLVSAGCGESTRLPDSDEYPEQVSGLGSFDPLNYFGTWIGDLSLPLRIPDKQVDREEWANLVGRLRESGLQGLTADDRETLMRGALKAYFALVTSAEKRYVGDGIGSSDTVEAYTAVQGLLEGAGWHFTAGDGISIGGIFNIFDGWSTVSRSVGVSPDGKSATFLWSGKATAQSNVFSNTQYSYLAAWSVQVVGGDLVVNPLQAGGHGTLSLNPAIKIGLSAVPFFGGIISTVIGAVDLYELLGGRLGDFLLGIEGFSNAVYY